MNEERTKGNRPRNFKHQKLLPWSCKLHELHNEVHRGEMNFKDDFVKFNTATQS